MVGPGKGISKLVYDILSELNPVDIGLFTIDIDTDGNIGKWLWFMLQPQNLNFAIGGWGETLLLKKGTLLDLVRPDKLGPETTKSKITEWINLKE